MELIQITLLALLQGLTEFLPISSSAHLILFPRFTDWSDQGLAFDVAVHLGTLTAVVFLLVPELFARIYSSDADVVALAAVLIPLAGVFQVFDGLQVVASGVLRGVADTRFPMVVNLVGFWCLGMPVSIWLGFGTGAGPVGLWWGLVVGLAAVAVFLLVRVRARLGMELRRIVIDEEE